MVAFALMLPVVVGSVGMSMDLAQAYLVRQRLGGALDAAALAATASATDVVAIEQRVNDFFNANYPLDKIGAAYDLRVTLDGDDVIVSASAAFDTTFMSVLGIHDLTVYKETAVRREVRGLEVVMVVDNTGSMASNNNIQALRDAAEGFVNILFDRTSDPNNIKVALVPYSSSVNVGPYGIGETPAGNIYADGTPFVTLPAGVTYTTNARTRNPNEWFGCVLAYNEAGYDPNSRVNDPYPDDALDSYVGPWDPYKFEIYGWNWDNDRSRWDYTPGQYGNYIYPNYFCPRTVLVPLTSDRQKLLTSITSMRADGWTLGNYGMTWGWRVLSPELPFAEGEEWGDPRWRKAIIMMTDGINTMESNYTAYWRSRNHDISPNDLNVRFEETCDDLKARDVIIYTVTFSSGVSENTKDFYRRCATSEGQYFDAPSQSDLIEVFEHISRELANLHIRS